MRAQLMIQISKNQDEAFSELKDQTLKPKPWLYAKTALETSTIFWASVYGLSGLRSLGIEGFGGNADGAQISSAIIAHPVCMMVVLAGFAPLTEECLFRYLPRALLGKSWNVGVAASLVFEFAHNIHQIPLPQISDGFYFWYLMKSRGLPYSIAAHSILGAWVVFSTLYL
jgi:membrane protease YdiL (CAAX protease family)